MKYLESTPGVSVPRLPSCLRRWRKCESPRLRLVCLPWCGAGAGVYRRLVELLPPSIDALAVQLPGREDRFGEAPRRRMADVVDLVVDDLVGQCDLPIAIFGHSMGAVVAHELAHALRSRIGREPDLLVVSGHGAATPMRFGPSRWHDASEDDLLHYISVMGGTPQAVLGDRAMMRALLPTLRADYEVLETYVCARRAPLHCPLVACAGTDDAAVDAAALGAWRELTTGYSALHWFEGGHFYLRDAAQPLAGKLAGWLRTLVRAEVAAT